MIAARGAFALLFVALGVPLIVLSEDFAFVNQGDFARVVDFMLAIEGPYRPAWAFIHAGALPPRLLDVNAWFFAAVAWLQLPFTHTFHIAFSSVAAKLVLLGGLAVLAHAVSAGQAWLRALAFTALAIAAFQVHNSALLKSFYTEVAFALGLPFVLAGAMAARSRAGQAMLLAGTLVCGLAKVQFFYMPALVLGVAWIAARAAGQPLPRMLVAGLVAVQLLCLLSLGGNAHTQVNRHHSTYVGTYMVMDASERQRIGVDGDATTCIGVDAWGNKLSGSGGTQVRGGAASCYGRAHLSFWDTLRPYVVFPSLAWRVAAFSLPEHFTVDYFHVYRNYAYRIQVASRWGGASAVLVGASRLRDRIVAPLAPWLCVAGLLLAGHAMLRREPGWIACLLLLPALLVSQVAVSLLGEGVRDLSKHLWGAQFGLDLLLGLGAVRLVQLARGRGHRPARRAEDEKIEPS